MKIDFLHTGLTEVRGGLFYSLAHGADGVGLPGDEKHRQLGIHLFQIAALLNETYAADQLAREADRRVAAAEGVCRIAVDDLRVGADPVVGRAHRLEFIIVCAEHQRGQELAVSGLAHAELLFRAERSARGQHRRRLPACAADDRAGKRRVRVPDEDRARQEGTHTVAEEEIRQLREFLVRARQKRIAILGRRFPAAGKIQARALGLSVAHVVLRHDQHTVRIEKARKFVIAEHMLCDAMDDLYDRNRLARRLPAIAVQRSAAQRGKLKFFHFDNLRVQIFGHHLCYTVPVGWETPDRKGVPCHEKRH